MKVIMFVLKAALAVIIVLTGATVFTMLAKAVVMAISPETWELAGMFASLAGFILTGWLYAKFLNKTPIGFGK